MSQVGGGDAAAGAGLPVHRQARRGVPRQLAARLQGHQARHQGRAGVLHRRQLTASHTFTRAAMLTLLASSRGNTEMALL